MECRRVYFPFLFRYLWAAEIWLLRMEFTILGPFGITDEQFWEVYALGQFNGVINDCVF